MKPKSITSLFPLINSNVISRLGLLALLLGVSLATAGARERVLIDSGWRFKNGDPADVTTNVTVYSEIGNLAWLQFAELDTETALQATRPNPVATHAGENVSYVLTNYNDSAWRLLDLPHDWVVELPFTSSGDAGHGSKDKSGTNNIGWYRRTFTLPVGYSGRSVRLELSGTYRNALIWLNGRCIGRNVSGYVPNHLDVTPYVNSGGTNVLVVRVDAAKNEGWWYEGGGIYRHVWLVVTEPVHVAQWGTFVATTSLVGSNATLTVKTDVTNETAGAVTGSLTSTILDAGSNVVTATTSPLTLAAGQGMTVTQVVAVANAKLWSLESPYLYQMVSTVTNQTTLADTYETPFGVRMITWSPTNGVFVNGQHVEIQGTCNHQDHAGVGVALPDRLQYFRIERLKQMGANAYRCSHNPPTAELLDACDRLGMLVMDEARRVGYDSETLGQLERIIRRDRNHPGVFCWSLGNEVWDMQWRPEGATVMQAMQNLAHALDPTRLCTVAINGTWGSGFSTVIDVQGFNYSLGSLDPYHASHSLSNIIGTETGSTVTTRGIYTTDNTAGWLASYDIQDSRVSWGETAEQWWPFYHDRPWASGGFCWTGFDYRGEPTPFGWPCVNSHFGIMDTCGFPKDNFYYYQANWSPKPVFHLLPHWNWAGKEGQPISVWAYGNCDLVELFLNGVSQGQQALVVNNHVAWSVPYAAGTLQAVGYLNGVAIITNTVVTTGTPAAIALWPDRSTITADGRDVAVVTVAVLDSQGRVVPTATNLVNFTVSGGAIIGVGDGDPSSHESDKGSQRSVFNGFAQVIVQSTNVPGVITLSATATGLTSTNVAITEAATPPAPAAPGGIAAVAGNGQIAISWDVVPGAFTYNVKRANTSGGPYSPMVANTGVMGFTDTAVSNLVIYYYVVTAVNANGESVNSVEISATPRVLPVPTVPTGFVAIRGDGQVSLSWTTSSGATSYNLKRATTSGGPYPIVTNATTTSLVATGLANGTTYYFVVSALNLNGESTNSSEASATPTALVAGLTASVVNSQVQLQWNAYPGATAYHVKRALVSGGPYTTLASNLVTTNFTDTTVGTCQTNYYAVTMTLSGVESAPSVEANAFLPGGAPPSPWLETDIGSVNPAGSSAYCNGQFAISGAGADIWNTADAFHFVYVYVPLSTNCDIRARVASVQSTHSNAKAAVMIRESLAANSRHALADVQPSSGIEFLWRTNTGSATSVSSIAGTAPKWVRLTRTNNNFQAYYSADEGYNWVQIGSAVSITMSNGAYVGLAVCSHANGTLNTSVMDNVSASFLPANTAPVLNPISNVTTNVGGTVTRTAVASDTNSPAQTLTFSLLAGPPNSLTQINNTNAVFSWRPSVNYANTTNLITLKVADNGSPSLSATQSFTVTINPLTLPSIASATLNGGQLQFQVNGVTGPDYAVQVSSNLTDWSTQLITNAPTLPWTWSDTNAPALPTRFYRIKVGPPLP